MRRLLLVDDEPYIVNGLAALIKECEFLELEVYKAYSADEALEWLGRTAMDIVMTDIAMPDLDGLELQRLILQKWPRCKVIFLTGYDDFSYIKEAIHNGAVHYILKNEGDKVILETIERALEQLDIEMANRMELAKTQARLQIALPSLQKEWVQQLLDGESLGSRPLQEQLNELEINLLADQPVLLVMAKVDLHSYSSSSDKTLLLFALDNVAQDFWKGFVNYHSSALDKSTVLWLIQQTQNNEGLSIQRFVQEAVERIQQTSRELLKLDVSFALAGEAHSMKRVPQQYARLQQLLRNSLGTGQELLLDGEEPFSDAVDSSTYINRTMRQIERLENSMENNEQEDWLAGIEVLVNDAALQLLPDVRQIISYRLVSVMMTYAINHDLQHMRPEFQLGDWMHAVTYGEWQASIHSMANLGATLFHHKKNKADQSGRSLVLRIKRYIEAHLADDLSLTRIGEEVAYNPYYLSKLYKQLTGEGLLEAIMSMRIQEAKRQLRETDDKIQVIASRVGFESAAYFTRYFKKSTERTPLEYRENSRK